LAAVVLAVLPLAILELVLRVAGSPPPDESAWVELHQLKPLFELDESEHRWRIPPSRSNFFQPASFNADKPIDTRRVFVLGGSTVQGRPWATETAFSTWLRLRLQAADSDHVYEVVNCGGVSYASYRVDKILDEVLTHKPDAIVLYTGHNEFLEDRTYADARAMTPIERAATNITRHVRIASLVSRMIHGVPKTSKTEMKSEVDAALDHTASLDEYERDPAWRQAVERHFHKTLEGMIAKCKQADVLTIVCEPACDLVNTPPFKSLPPMRLELGGISDVAAANQLRRWIRRNDHSADAHYRLGRILYANKKTDEAVKHLTLARDEDVCPLRATTPIVASVKSICADNKITLVPTIQTLDDRNADGLRQPDGIADPQWFVDHVHPTIAGHQRIAEAIAAEFQIAGWGNQDDVAAERYRESVTRQMSMLGEEYFARGKQRLEGLRRWASGRAAAIGVHP
tara:strand:- start:326021 stop:327391 length:1371 start_codon:yes stop_codon:yes gene_type:complete